MIDRAYVDALLGELAAAVGLAGLRLDDGDACAFAVDDGAIRVDLRFLPQLDAIDLMVWPPELELSGKRVLAMMAANFCWQGAEGATLALEPRSRTPVLQRRCFENDLAHGGLRRRSSGWCATPGCCRAIWRRSMTGSGSRRHARAERRIARMTYLSFDSYVNKARENLDGTVRIAKGDQTDTQLINNKGSFGHSVATFFKSIGSLLGFEDQTREDRNKTSLEGFKKALTEQFGETVALKAWGDKNLDGVGKLTGKMIIEVSDHAKSLRLENRAKNDNTFKDCLPIDYRDRAYPGGKFFGEICKNVGYDLDVARTLTPERYDAYCDRLMTAFNGRPSSTRWRSRRRRPRRSAKPSSSRS
jgi:hypothetical protein